MRWPTIYRCGKRGASSNVSKCDLGRSKVVENKIFGKGCPADFDRVLSSKRPGLCKFLPLEMKFHNQMSLVMLYVCFNSIWFTLQVMNVQEREGDTKVWYFGSKMWCLFCLLVQWVYSYLYSDNKIIWYEGWDLRIVFQGYCVAIWKRRIYNG